MFVCICIITLSGVIDSNIILLKLFFFGDIQPHQDGPAYFPVVAIVSLGSPVVMDFSPHLGLTNSTNQSGNGMEDIVSGTGAPDRNLQKTYKPFSVLLMPRSLLIFKDKAYSGSHIKMLFISS